MEDSPRYSQDVQSEAKPTVKEGGGFAPLGQHPPYKNWTPFSFERNKRYCDVDDGERLK